MWWYFIKSKETESYVEYRYARESRNVSGIVALDKVSEKVRVISPCDGDDNNDAKYAARKLFILQEKGYPDSYQVACG